MKAILISTVLALSFSAMAEDVLPDNTACKNIRAACVAAGYKQGAHKEGKGLWMHCIHKLKAGESVPGVTVSPEDLKACKVKMEEKKDKH